MSELHQQSFGTLPTAIDCCLGIDLVLWEPIRMELFALPDALIERILSICDVETIANAAAVSRSLQRVASSESLWLRICQQQFTDTDPRQWHSAQETGRMHQNYR